MKRKYLKPLFVVGCLIVITGAAMAYSSRGNPWIPNLITGPNPGNPDKNGVISLTGRLVQDKVLQGGSGTADLALTLHADDMLNPDKGIALHADMVIVLDRSGSMKGSKIRNAKRAVLNLYPICLRKIGLLWSPIPTELKNTLIWFLLPVLIAGT